MLARFLIFYASALLLLSPAYAEVSSVAVAANMKEAFSEIAAAFKGAGNPELRVVYGSSGNFTAQIMNGAPFNLFIAADEHFPLELYKSGKTIDEGAVYAIGKLAVLTKNSSGIQLGGDKAALVKAINKANKIAIAKPELAPYGKAAVEYLKAEGLWDLAKGKLVYGDNIGLVTTYIVTGAADMGFTAVSLAKSAEVSKDANYLVLNEQLYQPIKQRMVLIKGAPPEARELYQFMLTPAAKVILQKYGYSIP